MERWIREGFKEKGKDFLIEMSRILPACAGDVELRMDHINVINVYMIGKDKSCQKSGATKENSVMSHLTYWIIYSPGCFLQKTRCIVAL